MLERDNKNFGFASPKYLINLAYLLNNRSIDEQIFIFNNLEEKLLDYICPEKYNVFSGHGYFPAIGERFNLLFNTITDETIKQLILEKIDGHFCKIYNALRIGQSSYFKTNFLDELYAECGNNKEQRVRKILAHIADSPENSRSRITWNIMLYPSQEWAKEIYLSAFRSSAWWAGSYCTRTSTNFYLSSRMYGNYVEFSNSADQKEKENWEHKLKEADNRPGTRLNKIKLLLQ